MIATQLQMMGKKAACVKAARGLRMKRVKSGILTPTVDQLAVQLLSAHMISQDLVEPETLARCCQMSPLPLACRQVQMVKPTIVLSTETILMVKRGRSRWVGMSRSGNWMVHTTK